MNQHSNKNRSRRLRKKLHLGEFVEYGVKVAIRLQENANSDQALDQWLTFVEANNMAFGGGQRPGEINGFVTTFGRGTLTEDDRQKISNWLDAQAEVQGADVSPLLDAHYPEHWPEQWQ